MTKSMSTGICRHARAQRSGLVAALLLVCAARQPAAAGSVDFGWSGAVTTTSARVKARLATNGLIVRCAISLDSSLGSPQYVGPDTAFTARGGIVDFRVAGLEPDTKYHYAFEVSGVLEPDLIGDFRTFAAAPDSFRIVLGSCAATGSNHTVFATMATHDPLFFLHLGDLHYQNIAVNDVNAYRAAFQTVLGAPNQRALYQHHPLVYIWDDHDYGPNNSDSTAPGRTAARLTYQEYVPHYDLAAGSGDVAIYRSFAVGRTFFILTDCRSARSPDATPDGPGKTMLGSVQKAWFTAELLMARDSYPLIVWANTLPWIGTGGSDSWQNYTYERREIADFLDTAGIAPQLCMVSGDAHMLAIDDGTNSGYAASGAHGFPVFHAAALDQSGSVKGGPYSEGTYPGGGQFGLMTVVDRGDSLIVNWSGRNAADQELVAYRFAVPGGSGCGLPRTGDMDAGGSVTASDIIALVNYIFKAGAEPAGCEAVADANCNGIVTSVDIIVLVNYVFKGGSPPCDICPLVPSVWPCAS